MKWLRRLAWACAVLALVWAAAWLGVPPLLQSQAQQRLSAALGRAVTIGAVEFRPWSLELTLRDVAVAGAAAAGPPLLHVDRLYANGDWLSVFRLAPVIKGLEIDAPRVSFARTAPGRYDFDDLVRRLKSSPGEPQAESQPARFAVYNVTLRDGAIDFDDRPVARRHQVAGMLLTLPFLSDLPSQVDIKVEPRLAFTFDGTRLDSGAQATPFARSRDTSLTLRMADFDLALARPYLPHDLPVDLQRGRVQADLSLHFALREDGRPSLSLRGSAKASDIALADRAGAPLAAWKSLQVGLADVQPLERRIDLGTVRFDGLEVALVRDKAGRLNVMSLGSGTTGDAPAPASPWRVGVQSFELAASRVLWNDAATSPAASLRLDAIDGKAGPIAWPSGPPAPLTLRAQLRGADPAASAARLQVQGVAGLAKANALVRADDLPLGLFAPYVAQALVPRVEGTAALEAMLDWAAEPAVMAIDVKQASVDGLRVIEAAARASREPLTWKKLDVADAHVDVPGRKASIGRARLDQPRVDVERARGGTINLARWVVASPPHAASAAAAPWQVHLAQASVDDVRVRWRDAAADTTAPAEPVRLDVSALKLSVDGLDWPASTAPAQVQVSAVVADPAAPRGTRRVRGGTIDWRGRVAAAPLALRGLLRIERFPLHAVEPYFANGLNLSVQRADVNWRGNVSARQRADGFEADAAGEALLADLHVYGTDPDTHAVSPDELLGWQSFRLRGLKFAMSPKARPRIEVGEAVVSDFYSKLVVTEQGRFNLRDLTVPAGAASSPPGGFAVGPQIVASAPAGAAPAPPRAPSAPSAPPGAASAPAAAGLPVDIRVGGLQLVNGRVDYTDRFVRPNYSAAISELNGRLGEFRSGTRQMAALELHGHVAGTAQLDIQGSLNPTADPLALDVGARATDLELAPLSPYAGKYAGYAIERGKLSMDVHYLVQDDGRLEASNHVVLNQLTFGDRIESPDATKLPVRLAVALLKDRHGVIDINLPVSGSINDPQFSVAGIVFKLIVNLIAKALTAPFSLLAGGGGEDLSTVGFVAGTSVIEPGAQPVIEKVAKALDDRPSLQLTVTGSADAVGEGEAIRQAMLDRRIALLLRNESLRASGAASVPAAVPPGERPRLVRAIYRDADLPDKPRNVLGLAKDIPAPEMEALLKKHMVVTDEAARELALQRSVAVRDALVAKGLPSERLFLAAPRLHTTGEEDAAWKPRVQLALSVK